MSANHDEDSEKLSNRAERVGENQSSNAVGYGRPPRHAQFKPGESGNPLGRPKRRLSFESELADELARPILEHGREITQIRAILRRLVADALAGDSKVGLALIGVCAKLFRDQEADPRAAEDDAFVEKLGGREPDAAEKIGDGLTADSKGAGE